MALVEYFVMCGQNGNELTFDASTGWLVYLVYYAYNIIMYVYII